MTDSKRNLTAAIILGTSIIFAAILFALSNRYEVLRGVIITDKWSGEFYVAERVDDSFSEAYLINFFILALAVGVIVLLFVFLINKNIQHSRKDSSPSVKPSNEKEDDLKEKEEKTENTEQEPLRLSLSENDFRLITYGHILEKELSGNKKVSVYLSEIDIGKLQKILEEAFEYQKVNIGPVYWNGMIIDTKTSIEDIISAREMLKEALERNQKESKQ